MGRKSFLLVTAGVVAISTAGEALAQGTEVEEVVVTGSRLAQTGYTTPTPVTVVTSEQLRQAAPNSLSQGLNQLPQFQGSLNASSTNSQASATLGQHGNTLALRNLGPERTLVLLDGRRVPPSRYQGTVDVDILPELLVKRVDVVTGGTSAVYGSDAVAGVVNYILDDDFTGGKVNVQGGASTYGGSKSYKVGVAWGHPVGDRGHFLFSAEHASNDEVLRRERDAKYNAMAPQWIGTNTAPGAPTSGTAANPYRIAFNVVNNAGSPNGIFASGPAGIINTTTNSQGVSIPFDFGLPTNVPGTQIGGSSPYVDVNQTLIASHVYDQMFGQFKYEISERVTARVQGTYNKSKAGFGGSGSFFTALQLFSGNPYLPTAVQAIMTAQNVASVNYRKQEFQVAPARAREELEGWTAMASIEAELPMDLKFSAYYSHGQNKAAAAQYGTKQRNYYASSDAVRITAANVGTSGLPIGSIQCRVLTTSFASQYPGCVPQNLVGIDNLSGAALDYIRDYSRFWVDSKLDEVAADMSGKVFSLPAGDVQASVGAGWRHASLDLTSNADLATLDFATEFAGLRGVPSSALRFFPLNSGIANGSNSVKEVYGEIGVPLLADLPFADRLELTGAARYTDYSTSGTVETWKLGISYKPVRDLRIRATRSRDIRAPTLNELFAGDNIRLASIRDLHVNVQQTYSSIVGGNRNLKPERGNTKALGVVYQPGWLPRLNMSIDYYDIQIKGAINSPVAVNILQDCENTNGASPSCNLISRPFPFSNRTAANALTALRQSPLNTAFQAIKGFDAEANYNVDLDTVMSSLEGNVAFHAVVGHVSSYKTQLDAVSPVRSLAGTTDGLIPKWRGLFSAKYTNGPVGAFGQMRYIGRMKLGPSFVYNPDHFNPVVYFDTTATYDAEIAGANTQFFLSVTNLLNRKPPLFPTQGGVPGPRYPTVTEVYDIMGRYFTGGVRVRF